MPTPLSIVQHFDATAEQVFALYNDRAFQEGKLASHNSLDPELVTLDSGENTLTVATRQSIPSSVLPSMVASMMPGNLTTERTENWRAEGDGYAADFAVLIKGAPASLKGTMTLVNDDSGSTLTIDGQAAVPIPMFGSKIEGVIVEQVGEILRGEDDYTKDALTRS